MVTSHKQTSRTLRVQRTIILLEVLEQRYGAHLSSLLTISSNCSAHAPTESLPSLIMKVLILAIFDLKIQITKKLCQSKVLYGYSSIHVHTLEKGFERRD